MELSEKAATAYLVWSQYQNALTNGVFKTEEHKKIVVEGELLWRQRYLDATEDQAEVIMKKAGCNISNDGERKYCITLIILFIMQIDGSVFQCWIP